MDRSNPLEICCPFVGGWFGAVATTLVTPTKLSYIRLARLVLGSVTPDHLPRVYHLGIYPGQLSLAVPPWVGAMSNGDDCRHR